MVFYTCEKCNKQFIKKGNFNKHINKKIPCLKFKEIIGVETIVNEKLNEFNNEDIGVKENTVNATKYKNKR
jgi:hypothetical protein